MFQFQNGAIKRNLEILHIGDSNTFQFQNGAIKSFRFSIYEREWNMFQFQNGAIKSCMPPASPISHILVSIPKWCD